MCVSPSLGQASPLRRCWGGSVHETWEKLEAGEQLDVASAIPEGARRLEQETGIILGARGWREADGLQGELIGVGDGFDLGAEGAR